MASSNAPDRSLCAAAPSSPSRAGADSMEDRDLSHCRKRPRLDSGSRTMSADRAISSPTQAICDKDAPSSAHGSKLPPSPPSTVETPADARVHSPNQNSAQTAVVPCPPNIENTLHTPAQPSPSPSPMQIVNEDDRETPETMQLGSHIDLTAESPLIEEVLDDSDDAIHTRTDSILTFEEDAVLELLQTFPISSSRGGPIQATLGLAEHCLKARSLDYASIEQLERWLSRHLRHSRNDKAEWMHLYSSTWELWRNLATVMLHLLSRQLPFDTRWTRQHVGTLLANLFSRLAVIFSRLISLDIQNVSSVSPRASRPPSILSVPYLVAFNHAFRPRKEDISFYKGSMYTMQMPLDPGEATLWTSLPDQSIILEAAHAFVEPEADGAQYLVHLASTLLGPMYHFTNLRDPLKYSLSIIQHLVSIGVVSNRQGEEEVMQRRDSWVSLASHAYHMFESISKELHASVEKPARSPSLDAEFSKELIRYVEYLPCGLARLDPHLCKSMFNKFIQPTQMPDDFDRDLLQCIWVIKLLKCFLCKGRMDMRITGVEMMHHELVSIWHRYDMDPSCDSLKCVARTLLEEQILDYLVGPDSHPQLISRCSNVVGFLAVTDFYTTAHTELIWNVISGHQDYRIAAATLLMLRNMLSYLSLPQLHHICAKLQLSAVERFGVESRRLVDSLLICVREKLETGGGEAASKASVPSFLGLRILREALSPPAVEVGDMAGFGLDTFTFVYCRIARSEDRCQILQNCIEDVNVGSATSAGSAQALIQAITGEYSVEALTYLTEHLNASLVVIERICRLIKSEERVPSDELFGYNFNSHIELFHYLVLDRPESVPTDLDDIIWNHLVGCAALNNDFRDRGWECFRLIAEKASRPSSFIDRGLIHQLPRLSPETFTPSSYRFLEAAANYESRFHSQEDTQQSDSVHVPLRDQLWNCILTVPPNSIENEATNLFVTLHLLPEHAKARLRPVLELTHVSLVQKCIEQLTRACYTLESSGRSREIESAVPTAELSDGETEKAKLCIRRTLRLLTVMLQRIRANKDLSPTPARNSPKSKTPNASEPISEPILMKYQTFDGNEQSEIDALTVCGRDSLFELRQSLSDMTGFASYRLICGGQQIDLDKNRDITISESGIASRGLLMIIKKTDGQISQGSPPTAMGGSAFERELLQHVDTLYQLMDSNDDYSYFILDFLRYFKPHGMALQLVTSSSTTTADIFMSRKINKTLYLLQCLRLHLNEQIHQDTLHLSFLLHSIHLLDDACRHGALSDQSLATPQQWNLTFETILCFCEFLRALPMDIDHQNLFADPSTLIDRLFCILWDTSTAGIQSTSNQTAALVARTLQLIFQAAAYDHSIWAIFCAREDFVDVHKMLLLHDDQQVRSSVASMILSLLDPRCSPSHLTHVMAAAGYFPLLDPIVPEAMQYKTKSLEFFDMALHIFQRSRENGLLAEDSLSTFYADWSALLLSICGQPRTQLSASDGPGTIASGDHIIARDIVDKGLFGLTRLLNLCAQLHDPSSSPLDSTALVTEIFSGLLFPCVSSPNSMNEENMTECTTVEIPVLDEPTRHELHKLVLALGSDIGTVLVVIKMSLDALDMGNARESPGWQIDRSDGIRSVTGYVGITNLSNTCYMNSLLSQLFMNVNFRRFMLSARVTSPEDQPLITEAQRLFANMQDSYAKFASSADFANAITGADGESIDVAVQMDVDEFFVQLFDLWESQLLFTEDKENFRKFYRGSYVTQIRPSDCPHVSEKMENFTALQLEVRGKGSLEESLRAYVEGDVMEGENKYQCTQCEGGRYSDYAVKRTCLKEIPDSLILHLKRFDYDLVKFVRHKVNDQFEFPARIDMSPYKLDDLTNPDAPKAEDLFDLAGILVHNGTAESGHYYSFIRERSVAPSEPPTWLEFNDTSVTDFDPGLIGTSCFGGPLLQGNQGDKRFSAYMLFYERASRLDSGARIMSDGMQLTPSTKVQVPIPIRTEIAAANRYYLTRYCLFDPDFPIFLRQLVEKVRVWTGDGRGELLELEDMTMELLFKALDRIIARTKDNPMLYDTVDALVEWACTNELLAYKALAFLGEHPDIALNLTIRNSSKHRYGVQKRFETILLNLREKDPTLYGMGGIAHLPDGTSLAFQKDGAFPKFVKGLAEQLSYLGPIDRLWEDFFGLFLKLANIGDFETGLLFYYGFLGNCLCILTRDLDGAHSSKFETAIRLIHRRDKRLPPFKNLIQLIYHLLNCIDIYASSVETNEDQITSYNSKSKKFGLTKKERALLSTYQNDDCLAFIPRICEWHEWNAELGDSNLSAGLLSMLVQQLKPNARLLSEIYHTLRILVRRTSSAMIQRYVVAATAFCRVCPREDMVSEIISEISEESETAGGEAGRAYLWFFEQLGRQRNERIDATAQGKTLRQYQMPTPEETRLDQGMDGTPAERDIAESSQAGTFYNLIIGAAPSWGISLLGCDEDPTTRENTLAVLEMLIFSHDPPSLPVGDILASKRGAGVDGTKDEDSPAPNTAAKTKRGHTKANDQDIVRVQTIRKMFYCGLVSCTRAQQKQMNKRFFLPMLETLERCSQWIIKLLGTKGEQAEHLKEMEGIQAEDKCFSDEDLCNWWQKLVTIARESWIEEEIVDLSDGEEFDEDDSDIPIDDQPTDPKLDSPR